MSRKHRLLRSAVEAIGSTPLVELSRLVKHHGVKGRILAKLEYLNPGHSKKDRVARQIIEDAEQSGALRPGQTVVELTSGNTGTGLAIVCAVKGYPFVAVMSRGNTIERARMMAALGAEVVLVKQARGSKPGQVSGEDLALVERQARKIVQQRNAFRADQFILPSNVRAYERGAAPEAWKQSGRSIDVFADFAGTAGLFVGCARYLRRVNPQVRCYVAEPATAPFLSGRRITNTSHKIQGGGYSRALPLFDPALVTGYLTITDRQAIAAARDLARLEGIFGGFSGGANAAATLALLRGREKGKNAMILICDSGLKYLSTDLYPMCIRRC